MEYLTIRLKEQFMEQGINTVTINNEFIMQVSLDQIIDFMKSIRANNVVIMECTICPDDARKLVRHSHVNKDDYRNTNVNDLAESMKSSFRKFEHNPIVLTRNGQVTNGIERLLACIQANSSFKTCIVFNKEREVYNDGSMESIFKIFCDKRIKMISERLLRYVGITTNVESDYIKFIANKADTFGEFCKEIVLSNYYPGTKGIIYHSSFLAASYVAYDTGKVTLKDIREAQYALNDFYNNNNLDGRTGIYSLMYEVYKNVRKYALSRTENCDALFWNTLLAYYCLVEKKEYFRNVHTMRDVYEYYNDFQYNDNHITNRTWEYIV